jgi:hypothetical protein
MNSLILKCTQIKVYLICMLKKVIARIRILQGSYSSCHVRACFLSVHKMDQIALIVQRQFYTMICDLLPGLAEISANEKQNKNIYMKKKRALPVVQSNLHAIGMYARSVQLDLWHHKSVDAICFNNQYTTSCASTR